MLSNAATLKRHTIFNSVTSKAQTPTIHSPLVFNEFLKQESDRQYASLSTLSPEFPLFHSDLFPSPPKGNLSWLRIPILAHLRAERGDQITAVHKLLILRE